MSESRRFQTEIDTGTGRQQLADLDVLVPAVSQDRSIGMVSKLAETVGVAAFTDGAGTSGTYQMLGSIPAGAILLGTKVLVPGAFAGDTTAVVIIGDGSDTDRYLTGTPSVFTAAATGVEVGVVSGAKLMLAVNRPTITITGAADFTSIVTDAGGSITVEIYYIDA